MTEKLYWPNKWVFILAAIGSAAGLGNLWRFPFLAYEHGGGAFVVAIIVANIIIGIPLLLLEVALGQMTQKGAPDALAHVRRGFRYVGWFALVMAFFVLSYYMAVIAWGVDFFASAFTLSWGTDTEGFFFSEILQISDGPGVVGGISWPVLSGLLLAYALVYFSVWKGVRSVSKVVVWTATIPFVILGVLIIRAVTLPGAMQGLALYLIPEWSALDNTELWLAAFSQVFFSLSVAFGIMVAYGSLKQRNSDITGSVIWVAIGNFIVSIMSGFVVFGTLGYMAGTQGVPVEDILAGGPSLVFVVFPQAISLMPAYNALIGVLFFGTLLALAIDSAFSLFEAVAVTFRDRFPSLGTNRLALAIAFITLVGSLPFTTAAGLYYLDILDHFVVNYGLIIVGLLEAVIVGWIWKGKELVKFVNEHSKLKIGASWLFAVRVITPLFLGILLVLNITEELKAPYGDYPVWAVLYIGVLPIIIAPILAYIIDWLTDRRARTQ